MPVDMVESISGILALYFINPHHIVISSHHKENLAFFCIRLESSSALKMAS